MKYWGVMSTRDHAIERHLGTAADPRAGNHRHPLMSVITTAKLRVLCSADDRTLLEPFG